MKKRAKSRAVAVVIAIVAGIGFGRPAPAQAPAKTAAPTKASATPAKSPVAPKKNPTIAASPAVATVGNARITRSEFDARTRQGEELYRTRASGPIPTEIRPLFRRQILETMIREQLILLEARRRGLALTAEQAEEQLKKDPFFTRNGMFDEAKFLAVKSTQPEQFQQAVAQIQSTHGAMKVKEDLERQCAPDEAALRAQIEGEMAEAKVEFLSLPRATFSGTEPEPTEAEILDDYRKHPAEFQRPAESRLRILLVNQPPLPANADQGQVQAWEARMQSRADSLVAVVRRGASIEDLGTMGELRDATVSAGRFPSYWLGGPRTREAALATAAGGVVPDAVRGERGWMVVRVVERQPLRTAPLAEAAPEIRRKLRERRAAMAEARDLEEIYASMRDSLRGPAFRVRYAVADSGRFEVPEPTAAELDRYYRGHQADYTRFDRATSSLQTQPFEQVRDEVRLRLLQERRLGAARAATERLLEVWRQGRRDPKLERTMTLLREVGPVPVGAAVDTGLAGAALTDSLARFAGPRVGRIQYRRGWAVYDVFAEVKDHVATPEQSRPLLLERRSARQAADQERAARRIFEENPDQFRSGNIVRFSRLMVEPPNPLDVRLTREEVEAWYTSHIDDYGAAELVRVRHILVRPRDETPQADAEARSKAEAILARVRAGESFRDLARELSDDEATRESGGDVGVFRRGMMLDAFEQVAFTMSPGDIRGPVKTEVGYHVLEGLEHTPAEVVPLKYAYANVAADAANEKSRRIARFRADSLFRAIKTPEAARAAAKRLDLVLYHDEHVIGSKAYLGELADYFSAIEKLKPRQLHPFVQEYRGLGFALTWCDTVLPPRDATWEEAREQALGVQQIESERRKMLLKRAELDSMLNAGWSLDSLAQLLGGFRQQTVTGGGPGLSGLGGAAIIDSLVLGKSSRPGALSPGQTTSWIEFPGGLGRVRLLERATPDPVILASRLESHRRVALEMNLRAAFDKLKQRFPVKILDRELEITELPDLTQMPS